MKHKFLKQQISKNFKNIFKALKIVSVRFDAMEIHYFRVEYKQLRAFLRMISKPGGKQVKIPKLLKKIYHITGKIRDLQLQQQRFLDFTSHLPKGSIAYIRILQNRIYKEERILIKNFHSQTILDCRRKMIHKLPNKIPPKQIIGFMEQKVKNIQSILAEGHFSDGNLHQIRKQLKDLFYIIKITQAFKSAIRFDSKLLNMDENKFASLLDQLGKFEDKCKSIMLLKISWIIKLKPYGRKLLFQIKSDWIKEKLFMKQLLIEAVKSVFEVPEQTVFA